MSGCSVGPSGLITTGPGCSDLNHDTLTVDQRDVQRAHDRNDRREALSASRVGHGAP